MNIKSCINLINNYPLTINDMSRLKSLIKEIAELIEKGDPRIDHIKDKKLLYVSLSELDKIVGMSKLKDSISSQVYYLINRSKKGNSKKMVNTILYGPPGVGKTTVGKILAKIWYSLGYLKDNTDNEDENNVELKNLFKGLYEGNKNAASSSVDWSKLIYAICIVFYIMLFFFYFNTIYKSIGPYYTALFVIGIILLFIFIYVYIMGGKFSSKSNENKTKISKKIAKDQINKDNKQNKVIEDKNGHNNSNNKLEDDSKSNDEIKNRDDLKLDLIKIVSRDDFVAGYLGQTSIKTKALLNANKGKVLFIDEAYSLYHDNRDMYGMEALTTLNLYLSENPDNVIVIFGGYKDLMQKGIFKAQPGLSRRCMWHFECDPYSYDELFEIFKRQVDKDGYNIMKHDYKKILELFKNNIDAFPNFGGDTERLSFYCQLEYSKDSLSSTLKDDIIKHDHIEKGIMLLRENNIKNKSNDKKQDDIDEKYIKNILNKMDATIPSSTTPVNNPSCTTSSKLSSNPSDDNVCPKKKTKTSTKKNTNHDNISYPLIEELDESEEVI